MSEYLFNGANPLVVQLEPGSPMPPPEALRRKIIIKNKKKHRTHKKAAQGGSGGSGGDSQFHVDLKEGRPEDVQGNGEIPRPPLEKDGSHESCPDEVDVNGKLFFVLVLFYY